jgi:hypothetical protein
VGSLFCCQRLNFAGILAFFKGRTDCRPRLGGVVEEEPGRGSEQAINEGHLLQGGDVEIADSGGMKKLQDVGVRVAFHGVKTCPRKGPHEPRRGPLDLLRPDAVDRVIGGSRFDQGLDTLKGIRSVNADRLLEILKEPAAERLCLTGLGHAHLDDGELVSPKPRDGVHASDRALKLGRKVLEERVAGRVSECVVHFLEVVDVEAENRDLALLALDGLEGDIESFTQEHPIGQSSKRIVEREVIGPLLRLDLGADVGCGSSVAGEDAIPDENGAAGDPACSVVALRVTIAAA